MKYWVLIGLLLGMLLLLDIGQRIHMITLGYEIEQLVEVRRNLRRTHKELLIERETLAALGRIEQIAVRSLGMKTPDSRQIIYVNTRKGERPTIPDPSGITVVRK